MQFASCHSLSRMVVSHALVAKGTLVICEYTNDDESMLDVARKVLSKINSQSGRRSYSFSGKLFHYLIISGLTYMCVTEQNGSVEIANTFLDRLSEDFVCEYNKPDTSFGSSSKNAVLTKILQKLLNNAANNPSFGMTKIQRVEKQLEEVTEIAKNNLTAAMERGESVDRMMELSNLISSRSLDFRKEARGVRNRVYWDEMGGKIKAILVFLGLFLGIVYYSFCGFSITCAA